MSYTIQLTSRDLLDLEWLAARGYDCGLFEALQATDDQFVWEIPEHKAWDIQTAMEGVEESWACLSWDSPLGVKISAFLESIV